MGKHKSKNTGRALWGARLVDGEIVIRSRHGRVLTEEDLDLVKILLASYWRGQSHAMKPRQDGGKEVESKTGLYHTLDPIVHFFTSYRVKRKLTVLSVARLMGLRSGARLTDLEIGKVRPLVEVLRDWGYVLGFNLMPIPIAMAAEIRDRVNKFIEDQYLQDLVNWGDYPPDDRQLGGKYADLSAAGGFLRDSEGAGSAEAGEATG